MENTTTSSETLAEALKLLEDAAKQKKEELKTVMSDKYTHLRKLMRENESGLVESLAHVRRQATDAATHARDAGIEKACALAGQVDQTVHHNPWPFIGGTAAVGLLLGFILGRVPRKCHHQ